MLVGFPFKAWLISYVSTVDLYHTTFVPFAKVPQFPRRRWRENSLRYRQKANGVSRATRDVIAEQGSTHLHVYSPHNRLDQQTPRGGYGMIIARVGSHEKCLEPDLAVKIECRWSDTNVSRAR